MKAKVTLGASVRRYIDPASGVVRQIFNNNKALVQWPSGKRSLVSIKRLRVVVPA